MKEKYSREGGAEIPHESRVEENADKAFGSMRVKTEQDLDKIIAKVFEEICGDYGKEEFFGVVVPALKRIYGTNYRSAGLRLLEIINDGASRKREEIRQYFNTVVSQEELDYAEKPKEETLESISKTINGLILEKKKKYGEKYKGIVAAVIYGSFAKKNFSTRSDLDVLYVAESDEEGEYIEDDEKWVHYAEDFDISLGRKIEPRIDDFYGVVSLNNQPQFEELAGKHSLLGGEYIIVSPYPEIKEKIASFLKGKSK